MTSPLSLSCPLRTEKVRRNVIHDGQVCSRRRGNGSLMISLSAFLGTSPTQKRSMFTEDETGCNWRGDVYTTREKKEGGETGFKNELEGETIYCGGIKPGRGKERNVPIGGQGKSVLIPSEGVKMNTMMNQGR